MYEQNSMRGISTVGVSAEITEIHDVFCDACPNRQAYIDATHQPHMQQISREVPETASLYDRINEWLEERSLPAYSNVRNMDGKELLKKMRESEKILETLSN
jgi:hypothetical protein